MKNFLLIMIACLICVSCGVKNDPEYKSQAKNIKTIKFV